MNILHLLFITEKVKGERICVIEHSFSMVLLQIQHFETFLVSFPLSKGKTILVVFVQR